MEDMRNEAALEADRARMIKTAQRMLKSDKKIIPMQILPTFWTSALMKSRL